MSRIRFRPSVTVAAVIEQDGRYLLVEEHTPEGLRLNNPAGHLEQAESPLQAVEREVLEETCCRFTAQAFLGVYLARLRRPSKTGAAPEDITYVRLAYSGQASPPEPDRRLDHGIVRTLWLSLEEIRAERHRLRSPLVMHCLEDHQAGRRFPLGAVTAHRSLWAP
jgi:8-oxo-dGTP pyrophosphatase MutT (NUDIX family)